MTYRTLNESHPDNDEFSAIEFIIITVLILFLGFAGSMIPSMIVKYYPHINLNKSVPFRFLNGLAAGVVLSVAFIHTIPDSFISFRNVLGENTLVEKFPWPGFCTMMGVLVIFMFEEFIHHNVGRFEVIHGHDHTHHSEQEIDIEIMGDNKYKDEITKYYSELYVLLFGLTFHCFFVGLALGIVDDDIALVIAVFFHQFFEGLALGSRVNRVKFKKTYHLWLLDLVYSLGTPIGIAVGYGVRNFVNNDKIGYGIINGIFQAASGGILINVCLIHLLKEELERKEFKAGGSLLWAMYLGVLLGATAMTVVGIWA